MTIYIAHIKNNENETYNSFAFLSDANYYLDNNKKDTDEIAEVIESTINNYQPLVVASIEDFCLTDKQRENLTDNEVNDILNSVESSFSRSGNVMDTYWDVVDYIKEEYFPNAEEMRLTTEEMNALCDKKDFTDLANELNYSLGYDNIYEVGFLLNERYTIIINNSITRQIFADENIKPLYQGKYWFVTNADDITPKIEDKLIDECLYLIDDICDKDFDR